MASHSSSRKEIPIFSSFHRLLRKACQSNLGRRRYSCTWTSTENACSAVQIKYDTKTVTEKWHHSVNSEIKFEQHLKEAMLKTCTLSWMCFVCLQRFSSGENKKHKMDEQYKSIQKELLKRMFSIIFLIFYDLILTHSLLFTYGIIIILFVKNKMLCAMEV